MFSRVFKTTVTALLEGGDDAMTGPQLANFTKMVSVKQNYQRPSVVCQRVVLSPVAYCFGLFVTC